MLFRNIWQQVALVVAVGVMFAGIQVAAQTSGAVYVNGNENPGNQVWSYARAADGTLTLAGSFATQGNGAGTAVLGSQGSLALAPNGKYLYVVNASSNDITAFAAQPGGMLSFVGRYPSGGKFPDSLGIYGSVLYVLNKVSDQITAFRVSAATGALKPLSGSTRNLSGTHVGGAQVSFNADGTLLTVVEHLSSKIDTYTVSADGRATGPQVFASSGVRPQGFAFDNKGHLLVSEAQPSAESSYSVSSGGQVQVITGTLRDLGLSGCWVANTNNANFPTQYSYVTNTDSDTVSGYNIATDGSLSLLDPSNGITAQLPAKAHPLDEVISSDSNYLYVLEAHLPGVGAYKINSDGSLTQVQTVTGTPRTAYGMTGN
ncbi:MAG: beta-propeller fold lactonase family protein [Acidobacteriales bacterium]|nr:beta-propeller fold lactonase family protein [Terriglobales bacterium]